MRTYLNVRFLRAPINETDRDADRFAQQLATFGGHTIGQCHCSHASWLCDGDQSLGVPSLFEQILWRIK